MKLKYIFAALTAIVAAVGCAKVEPAQSLSTIQLSKTYVSIPPAGSSDKNPVSITINSTIDWKLTSTLPDWISLSATSGKAGETKLVFTVPECAFGRQAELQIAAGIHTQFLTVRQGNLAAELVTCKESMEGTEGKTYRVKGSVVSIVNTTYGNMYLDDGSGKQCYVYGTLDKVGAEKNFLSLGIELGDVVTVEGPLKYYNPETPELVNVTVIKIEKALLKLDKDSFTVPKEGGIVTLKAAYKGNGVFVDFSENADWLSLAGMDYVAGVPTKLEKAPADTAVIKINVKQNTGDLRSSSFKVSSKSGSSATEMTVGVSQMGAEGTLTRPFTIAKAIEFCNTLTGATTENFYVKGKVSKIYSQYSAKYGTAIFWLSDDGTFQGSEDGKTTTDKTKNFEAYSVYWLENKPWVDGNAGVSVGDEVIICGQLTIYNGVAETNSKKAYVYSVNGIKVDDGNGFGNLNYPFNIKGAIAFCNSITGTSENDMYVKGKVSKIYSQFSAQYGTAIFWLSDDGTFQGSDDGKSTTDKTKNFEAYSVYWYNMQAWQEGFGVVAVQDEVILKGKLTNYNGLAETASKKACIYSINGKTE